MQEVSTGENTHFNIPAKRPLSRREQLDALGLEDSILIDEDNRQNWATEIYRFPKSKQFAIRTDRENGELRVWRLK